MTKVSRIYSEKPFSAEVISAVERLDSIIVAAVEQAYADGAPKGLVVGILHAHTHQATSKMVEEA